MTEHNDNAREAQRLLASRVEDMTYFLSEEYAETDHEGDDDHGSHYDYGLSWDKETTNHRQGTVTYAHVLSTGGPHDEFRVEFGENGDVVNVTYVYLPWFDRVEIEIDGSSWREPAEINRADTVQRFYESFYGDMVAEESER